MTMKKIGFVLVPALALVVALFGCGGSSSSNDLAVVASPHSLVYLEAELSPSGASKEDLDALAQKVAGVDNLGDFVVSKLEASAREDGEPVDFAKEVQPWLGEKAAVAFQALKGEKLTDPVVAIQTTDSTAAQAFVDRRTREGKASYRSGSYEGFEFEVGGSKDNAIGMIGDSLVIAEGEDGFKAAVDASRGESLADRGEFEETMGHAVDGSVADAFVDFGNLVTQSGNEIEPSALRALKTAGIEPSEVTAVLSLVPGEDRVEIDLNTTVGNEALPSGDASKMLGSMPGDAFAAFASSGFGEQLAKALDELDENGIPGQLEPHELKKSVSQLGFDVDKLASSLEDVGIFASGTGKDNLGGAVVLTTKDSSEATTAIKTIGLIVRQSGTPGVTALSGKASGFSVRSAELGPRPLVVATEDNRVAIGYGLPTTLRALKGAEPTLAESPLYKAAVEALGDTPIGGFVSGPGALDLARALVPKSESGFWEAVPYLKSVRYVAIGSGSEGDWATAKIIVGVGE